MLHRTKLYICVTNVYCMKRHINFKTVLLVGIYLRFNKYVTSFVFKVNVSSVSLDLVQICNEIYEFGP